MYLWDSILCVVKVVDNKISIIFITGNKNLEHVFNTQRIF